MVPALLFLTLGGCLERVTGEPQELDPRFYAGHVDPGQASPDGGGQASDPNAGGYGDKPWGSYQGETVEVKGTVTVTAADNGRIQIDVAVPDDSAQGGQKRVGAVILDEPGEFVLAVPKDVTKVKLEAFQDPDINGPSEQDPYAETLLDLSGGAPATPLTLALVVGARGQATPAAGPTGGGENGGSPTGEAAPPPPTGSDMFGDVEKLTVSGTVTAAAEGMISIDFFKSDPAVAGGRTFLFKQMTQAGPWQVKFPKDYGKIEVEAYQDPKGDGPTEGDPKCTYEKNPVEIGASDVSGIDLVIP